MKEMSLYGRMTPFPAPNSRKRTMSPAKKEADESTYSGRFAARLRMLREKAGLSVEQVVEAMIKAGYPLGVQTFYGWENGKRQVNWDAIPAIAKVLKTKPVDLIPPK
jgi:Helix-turn-helix domain